MNVIKKYFELYHRGQRIKVKIFYFVALAVIGIIVFLALLLFVISIFSK